MYIMKTSDVKQRVKMNTLKIHSRAKKDIIIRSKLAQLWGCSKELIKLQVYGAGLNWMVAK